jgi:predicted LPLAT superfamily acyltransferase
MLRNPDDTFTLTINKPIEFNINEENTQDQQSKEKYLLKIIDSYKGVMEEHIRKYPDQWYMFRRFWIE